MVTYNDPGVRKVELTDRATGSVTESFEMPGERKQLSQAKVTLPSYQEKIYRDPRYEMFRIHEYNGKRGFNLFDVEAFFGGADLVPQGVKRDYVASVLVYDMRTTIQAIQAEYRDKILPKEMTR